MCFLQRLGLKKLSQKDFFALRAQQCLYLRMGKGNSYCEAVVAITSEPRASGCVVGIRRVNKQTTGNAPRIFVGQNIGVNKNDLYQIIVKTVSVITYRNNFDLEVGKDPIRTARVNNTEEFHKEFRNAYLDRVRPISFETQDGIKITYPAAIELLPD